jgi:taurine dioxygenase
MSMNSLAVRRLTPAIGAELDGVDLSLPLSDAGFREIHDQLLENLVIFFRNQNLTPEQHKALGCRFGGLHIHPAPMDVLEGYPEIIIVKADESSVHIAGEDWHSDVSCDVEPPMASILYIKEVPPTGGDTLFASMYAAYEALSEIDAAVSVRPDGDPRRRAQLCGAARITGRFPAR